MAENELMLNDSVINVTTDKLKTRNYQVDFIKLVFALLIFWVHSFCFMNENTRFTVPPIDIGWIVVHCFFVLSGFFMIKSCEKHQEKEYSNVPKESLKFVLGKAGKLGPLYVVSFVLFYFTYIYVNFSLGNSEVYPFRIFPELFGLKSLGFDAGFAFNGPVWYISSMLIAMLPLVFVLIKFRNFYIYFFAPLLALLLFGYMFNVQPFFDRNSMNGIFSGGLIRAFCGMCFGAISWIICEKIRTISTKGITIVLTIIELLFSIIFVVAFFNPKGTAPDAYSVMFLIPIWLAIVFSEKSLISKLFSFNFMKYCGSLSMYIYFNHWAARYIVKFLFPGKSYKLSIVLMLTITASFCIVCYFIIKLIKHLWNKKLKKMILGT